jgi:hypothetical protein
MGEAGYSVEHKVFKSMETKPIELYVVTRD